MVWPDMIQIMLTTRCNIRCKMCDVWKMEYPEEMTTAEVSDLIRQAVALGVQTIYFTGGEALLRPDIIPLIKLAASFNVITTINTNGILIDDVMARELVSSGLHDVTISLDGASAQTHDYIRGKGVFEKAMQAFEHLQRAKNECKRDDFAIGSTCVITKHNLQELPALAELVHSRGGNYIAYQPLVNNGYARWETECNSKLWVGEEDIPQLEECFRALDRLKEKKIREGMSIDFMAEKTIQHYRRQHRVNTCFAGYNRFFINPKGDISFVCYESFGNVRTGTLRDAWLSEKAYELRKKIRCCNVNCTQFCSERPQSEKLSEIHRCLYEPLKKLGSLENAFLEEIHRELGGLEGKTEAMTKALEELQRLLNDKIRE